ININRANLPLNITSSLAFLRNPKLSRGLLESISTPRRAIGEGFQEAGEEIINLIAEKEGERSGLERNYEYDFSRTLSDIGSKEGLESALLGFLGGAIQTGGQGILNRADINNNNKRVLDQQYYYKELEESLKQS